MKESAENYLETILILKNRMGQVRSIDVVTETGFAKPSISEAVKKLRQEELIRVDVNGYISFTKAGLQKAENILERHRVLTEALKLLGVPADIADEDACKMEHNLNEITFQRIKAHMQKRRD